MLEAIEKLLILQERDRELAALEAELESLPPRRAARRAKAEQAHARAEAARQLSMQIEGQRRQLEIEVEGLQTQIERFLNQQMQTRKNEEYQALSREIENAKQKIVQLEDQQLELMEQGEKAQAALQEALAEAARIQAEVDKDLAALQQRETRLQEEFQRLRETRANLAGQVEPSLLQRYERLRHSKGGRVVVGIERGICGGCHVKLQAHLVLACRTDQQVVTCSNCSRILYYEPGMEL